jgi:4-hydroxy-3-methylbut-2-enyl diphosphate reductase
VEAERFARAGYEIVLVGHAGHVEVEGTMGHAPERIRLVETVEDAAALAPAEPGQLAVLTQTTLSVDDTREVMDALRQRFPGIRLPRKDDICYATQNRQNAVKQLVREAELVLVVGAPESSNSNRLVEIARKAGVPAHLVQTAEDIDPAWLAGKGCVGVTAGASAPEVLVEQVVARLAALAGGEAEVDSMPPIDEGVVFQLPGELREPEPA